MVADGPAGKEPAAGSGYHSLGSSTAVSAAGAAAAAAKVVFGQEEAVEEEGEEEHHYSEPERGFDLDIDVLVLVP